MRGDVLLAHVHQRVGIGLVRVVAHQRAAVALGVVVLGLWKAVVDEERDAVLQVVGEAADEGLGLGMDLGHGAWQEGAVHRRAQRGGPVGKCEAVARALHAALEPGAAIEVQQLHWHGIQHLVAHHHPAHAGGPGGDPGHPLTTTRQALGLPLAQRAGQINDGVAAKWHARIIQCADQLLGQRAGTRAKLDHLVGAAGPQRLRDRGRQRLAKQG